MDREACESPVHGSHSWTRPKRLSTCTHTSYSVLDIMIDVGNGQKPPMEFTLFWDLMDNSKINKQTVASKVTISAMEKSKIWKTYVYSVSGIKWGRVCVCIYMRESYGRAWYHLHWGRNSTQCFTHKKSQTLFCLTFKSGHIFRWECSFSKREKQWNLAIFKTDFCFDKFKQYFSSKIKIKKNSERTIKLQDKICLSKIIKLKEYTLNTMYLYKHCYSTIH